MFRTRRWTSAALIASLALSLAFTPAQALVGTRGQHPVTGATTAPSPFAELTFPALPVVVAGQRTIVSPLAFTTPEGVAVTDPAAAGYTFSTTWRREDGWVGDFYPDTTTAGPDGSLIFSPEFSHTPGIREAGILIHNPALGTSEYQLVRFEFVRADLAGFTNPAMDAISYRALSAQAGGTFSVSPAIWSRGTGDELPSAPSTYRFSLGAPDQQRGWSTPSFVTVTPDGTVTARPGAGEQDATYLVPVTATDTATGQSTTTIVSVQVGDIILKGSLGDYRYGDSSSGLFTGSSAR